MQKNERGARKPNFLIILTDDQGYADVSAYGRSDVRTPSIDRIGAEGLRFTGMRANATVCSPSRAALLTGKFPDRVGVPGVIRTDPADSWGYLKPGVATLADVLRRRGWHTAHVGKWHLGLESPNLPNDRGFQHFHGFLGDMMDSYTTHRRHGRNYMRQGRDVVDPSGHATDLFTDWACRYLTERSESPQTPFFLYLAYNAPHFPIEPPAEWLERVRLRAPGMDPKRAANVALVEHLDHGIGKVLETLDRTGLARDTVVVFASDNGGSIPHGQANDPWRGGKQDHFDGGLRVPFLMRWPTRIAPGRTSDYQGLNFDVFPTFVELAGGKPDPDLDAVSLVPILDGKRIDGIRDLYFCRREGGPAYAGKSYEALIRGNWKLLQNSPFGRRELYNLRDDPHETHDLSGSRPKELAEMTAALQAHVQRGGAVPWQPPAKSGTARG